MSNWREYERASTAAAPWTRRVGPADAKRLGQEFTLRGAAAREPYRIISDVPFSRCYCCHRCRSQGNQLELWAAATKLSLHPAMVELCRCWAGSAWIHRW